eukprot:Amastigsp_a340885_26.p4 type:complete len:163 gc:universal Amastigsp_a340885_26:590-1078(+)
MVRARTLRLFTSWRHTLSTSGRCPWRRACSARSRKRARTTSAVHVRVATRRTTSSRRRCACSWIRSATSSWRRTPRGPSAFTSSRRADWRSSTTRCRTRGICPSCSHSGSSSTPQTTSAPKRSSCLRSGSRPCGRDGCLRPLRSGSRQSTALLQRRSQTRQT